MSRTPTQSSYAVSDGVHIAYKVPGTGEIKILSDDIGGIAVDIGWSRISAMAGPGEVLVSSTVKDLVVGSEIEFEDRETHARKGVPDEWRIYAVTR